MGVGNFNYLVDRFIIIVNQIKVFVAGGNGLVLCNLIYFVVKDCSGFFDPVVNNFTVTISRQVNPCVCIVVILMDSAACVGGIFSVYIHQGSRDYCSRVLRILVCRDKYFSCIPMCLRVKVLVVRILGCILEGHSRKLLFARNYMCLGILSAGRTCAVLVVLIVPNFSYKNMSSKRCIFYGKGSTSFIASLLPHSFFFRDCFIAKDQIPDSLPPIGLMVCIRIHICNLIKVLIDFDLVRRSVSSVSGRSICLCDSICSCSVEVDCSQTILVSYNFDLIYFASDFYLGEIAFIWLWICFFGCHFVVCTYLTPVASYLDISMSLLVGEYSIFSSSDSNLFVVGFFYLGKVCFIRLRICGF